jgi:hypothetical protein
MAKNKLTLSNIFDELPIQVHNSHLVTALLHELDTPTIDADRLPSLTTFTSTQKTTTLAEDNAPLAPNFEVLDLELDPFMQKNLENLIDCADAQQQEHNNHQYWQRSVAREQTKIQAWLTKRVCTIELNGARNESSGMNTKSKFSNQFFFAIINRSKKMHNAHKSGSRHFPKMRCIAYSSCQRSPVVWSQCY